MKGIVADFRKRKKLEGLPLFFTGCSCEAQLLHECDGSIALYSRFGWEWHLTTKRSFLPAHPVLLAQRAAQSRSACRASWQ